MKMNVTFNRFNDMFLQYNRGDNFSFQNLRSLYDYLEEVFEGEYELDVIELCCTYSELSLSEMEASYGIDIEALDSADAVREALEAEGVDVIDVDDELNALIIP